MNKNKPIGIFDAGIGGLTTLAEMQKLLPNEDIIYIGDSANHPYGNRPPDEILRMVKFIIKFLEKNEVKVAAVACNTFSTFVDQYGKEFPFPFVTVTEPIVPYVASLGIKKIGVIATVTTINKQAHEKLIHAADPSIEVFGQGSKWLAKLIDPGTFDIVEIDREIKADMGELLSKADLTHVILGCTHYPIVTDRFQHLYPGITFIDPAYAQASATKELLENNNAFNPQKKKGRVTICTTGDPAVSEKIMSLLSNQPADEILKVTL